jgi:hypothetical protein
LKHFMLALGLLFLWSCGGPRANVRIALPLPPKLDLTNFSHVYFPGFIVETKNENIDPNAETINFFRREFQKRDVMDILPNPPLNMADKDARTFFEREQPFFKTLGFDPPKDTLAVTGSITFEILDRSGFRQVESTDITGRSYYRTQFVEITGFDLTMKVFVYDMEGKLLYTEALKDTLDVEGDSVDERLGYYELLQRMSDRVLGLFSNTVVKAERSLL